MALDLGSVIPALRSLAQLQEKTRLEVENASGRTNGTNLYAYVRGSPVNLIDPNGTDGRVALEEVTIWVDGPKGAAADPPQAQPATMGFPHPVPGPFPRNPPPPRPPPPPPLDSDPPRAPTSPGPTGPGPAARGPQSMSEVLPDNPLTNLKLLGKVVVPVGAFLYILSQEDNESTDYTVYAVDTEKQQSLQFHDLDEYQGYVNQRRKEKIAPGTGDPNSVRQAPGASTGTDLMQFPSGTPSRGSVQLPTDPSSKKGDIVPPGTTSRILHTGEAWKTPEGWADYDHDVLRDQLRKEKSGYESGRHNEYPAAMRDALRKLADEADEGGQLLPEYAARLREIANTYDKRSKEGHPGGRR
jgi:hypothetical protein